MIVSIWCKAMALAYGRPAGLVLVLCGYAVCVHAVSCVFVSYIVNHCLFEKIVFWSVPLENQSLKRMHFIIHVENTWK